MDSNLKHRTQTDTRYQFVSGRCGCYISECIQRTSGEKTSSSDRLF